jgi:hypothetical protein
MGRMTCDWGDCDEPIAAYRLDEGQFEASAQWLPVCVRHALIYPAGWHCGHCRPMHRCPDDPAGPGPCGCICQYSVQDIMDLAALG